jgi:hypothetical protein
MSFKVCVFDRFFVLADVAQPIQRRIYPRVRSQVQQHLGIGMTCMFIRAHHKVSIMQPQALLQIEHWPSSFIRVITEHLVNIIIFKSCSLKINLVLFNIFILMRPMVVFLVPLVYNVKECFYAYHNSLVIISRLR